MGVEGLGSGLTEDVILSKRLKEESEEPWRYPGGERAVETAMCHTVSKREPSRNGEECDQKERGVSCLVAVAEDFLAL